MILAKVVEERQITIENPDIDGVKGLWPIQVLAKLDDVELNLSTTFHNKLIKKTVEFFKVWQLKELLDDSHSSSFLGLQIVKILNQAGYPQMYHKIESQRGAFHPPLSFLPSHLLTYSHCSISKKQSRRNCSHMTN